MDLKVKRINWMGNIYQKFEAVCQEVDEIVGQDAVKYLENRVQNVGDSMKKLCSGVVHELLPFPNLESPAKYEAHSVALKKNVVSSFKSVGGGEDSNKNVDEENPINNFIKALHWQDSNAIYLANDQQSIAPDSVQLVGSGEDSNKNGDEENPINSFVEALQESSAIDLANDQQAGAPDKHEHLNQVGGETCSDYLEVEDSYTTQDEVGDDSREAAGVKKESIYVDKVDTGILAKVSPAVSSVSCERPITKTGPLCFKSSLISDCTYLKSQGSCSFEIESCKNSSGDVACCNSNSSMVHICCKSPQVAGQVMESHDGLVSTCCCQSKESNDESCLEDIQLNGDTKLGERCVFVDDSELHAVSCRAQKLRSYKKRIQDAFTSKKRLAKEYEQLAIWYGDTDMDPSQDLPRTLLPFRSRTHADSKHLQLLQASETEWELL